MRTLKIERAGWLATAVLVAAVGCANDRAIVYDPIGPMIINFPVFTGVSASLPAGSIQTLVLDPGVTDDSTVRFVVRNLPGLSAGAYQVWLADSAVTGSVSAAGRIIMITTVDDGAGGTMPDTTELAASASSFNPPSNTYNQIEVEVRQSGLGQNPQALYNAFVTIEDAAATTPSTARFLFRRTTGGTFAGSLVFGNFGDAARSDDVAYSFAAANGFGGVRGDEEISVDINELSRPPRGFYYEGWLLSESQPAVRIDVLKTPYPERMSLLDADQNFGCAPGACEPNSTGTEILKSNVRGFPSDMGLPATKSFCEYNELRLMVQPKAASGMGVSYVLTAGLPEPVLLGCV